MQKSLKFLAQKGPTGRVNFFIGILSKQSWFCFTKEIKLEKISKTTSVEKCK